MKKTALFLMLISVFATQFVACKKDDGDTTTTASTSVTVTASLLGFDGTGGTAFKSSTGKVTKTANNYALTAVEDGAKRTITIALNNITAVGTVSLDKGNASGNLSTLIKDNTSADAAFTYRTDGISPNGIIGGGSVQITKLTDTEIEAKFYIIAYNSAKIASFVENGVFTGKISK